MTSLADNFKWRSTETAINAKRADKCRQTLTKLLGPSTANNAHQDHYPRVAIALSGGGWRAMTSAVALLDALATPLDKTETAAKEDGVKLLDTVSNIFGLSGGSWAGFVTLAGGERNPFHHDPTDPTPIGPADRAAHPWLHGQKNRFDPRVHTYEGLKKMTDSAHVSRACYRGSRRAYLANLSATSVVDTTLPTVLTAKLLGPTLVDRWANFLANDILSFKDRCDVRAPSDEAVAVLEASATANEGSDATVAKKVAAKDPNIGSNARGVTLSSLRTIVAEGDFPMVCNTAIADKKKGGAASSSPASPTTSADNNKAKPSNSTRLYDWVEISPYYIRNSATGEYTEDVDNCAGCFAPSDPNKAANPRVDMRVHHFMAVCGSAFACDVGSVIPKDASALIRDNFAVPSGPIVGSGLTEITYGRGEGAPSSLCRDAGIDFNVPFPPALQGSSGRTFDIIIAMDAGADSNSAYELQRAIELGYLTLAPAGPNCHGPNSPAERFYDGERVRVYRSTSDNGPTIIYFLGLTKAPTSKIIHNEEGRVVKDCQALREAIAAELAPIYLAELRRLRDPARAGGYVPRPPPVKGPSPLESVAGAAGEKLSGAAGAALGFGKGLFGKK